MSTVLTADNPKALETEQLLRELRRTHEELDHLVRALSHDMNANFMLLESSFSQLKQTLRSASPAECQETVAHVDACLNASKRLLEDLVCLGKTGGVEMEPSRVELDGVVEDVLFEQDELIRGRGARVDVCKPLPALWCNPQRVQQILTNLIRNALSHGCAPDCPRIVVSGGCVDAKGTCRGGRETAWFRVHDNGPGIDPAVQDEIFLPGRRLAQAVCEGSGMGLAIIRKIAAYYGGSARMDPDCREGMALEVRLPAAPVGVGERPCEDQPPSDTGDGAQSVGHDGPHQESPPLPHGTFPQPTERHRRQQEMNRPGWDEPTGSARSI